MTDSYWCAGRKIGRSLAEAVDWVQKNPEKWKHNTVYLDMEPGTEAINVDADIRDEIAKAQEDAKSDIQVLTEAVQQLSAALLRTQLEASVKLDEIKAEIAELRKGRLGD